MWKVGLRLWDCNFHHSRLCDSDLTEKWSTSKKDLNILNFFLSSKNVSFWIASNNPSNYLNTLKIFWITSFYFFECPWILSYGWTPPNFLHILKNENLLLKKHLFPILSQFWNCCGNFRNISRMIAANLKPVSNRSKEVSFTNAHTVIQY